MRRSSKILTGPVYSSKEVIPVGERKWNDILACKSLNGDSLHAEILNFVMRLVRHYDQDERKTEGGVHWNLYGSKTAESISEVRRANILGIGLASTHLWRKQQDSKRKAKVGQHMTSDVVNLEWRSCTIQRRPNECSFMTSADRTSTRGVS